MRLNRAQRLARVVIWYGLASGLLCWIVVTTPLDEAGELSGDFSFISGAFLVGGAAWLTFSVGWMYARINPRLKPGPRPGTFDLARDTLRQPRQDDRVGGEGVQIEELRVALDRPRLGEVAQALRMAVLWPAPRRYGFFALVLGLGLALAWLARSRAGLVPQGSLPIVAAVMAVCLAVALNWIVALLILRTVGGKGTTTEQLFCAQGFSISEPPLALRPWSEVTSVVQARRLYAFFADERLITFVPKRCLENAKQMDEFQRLLEQLRRAGSIRLD